MSSEYDYDIAVTGMACHFPAAGDIEEFWSLLLQGKECVRFLTGEELREKKVPEEMQNHPDYVNAASVLDDVELFDADFFGYTPSEAVCMDPQQRLFLQCCWHAFENGGVNPYNFNGSIGVFAGMGMNSYISEVLMKNPEFLRSINQFQLLIGNDKDFLSTQVSYKMNLKGPSINVNTACSTSLVAIHLARQSILLGECDMALAGGVSVFLPNSKGYLYIKDTILSPDGHCRAFDAGAGGTVWGDGCGVVMLKRYSQALRDKDHIYAVIRGSAVNNDGALKAGYTAPSVNGQSATIIEALSVADVNPGEIGFIETHGTGTILGDPIEIAALDQAFNMKEKGICPIGSVKTNLGHLNSAAGVAGFIKAVLSIYHRKLPPSLNFHTPNPKIGFENSFFYVNDKVLDLGEGPLFGGISSMGIGGTNAHIVIGSHEPEKRSGVAGEKILPLSARSPGALEKVKSNFALFLRQNGDISLGDAAYTLQCGRKSFDHRLAVVCSSREEALAILASEDLILTSGEQVAGTGMKDLLLKNWLDGKEVDWRSLYTDDHPGKVPLPLYPFEKRRFWVDPPEKEDQPPVDHYRKQEDMNKWFYMTSWKQSERLPGETGMEPCDVLLFHDRGPLCNEVVSELCERGNRVTQVFRGEQSHQSEANLFFLNPSEADGFAWLLGALKQGASLPREILFFWGFNEKGRKSGFSLDEWMSSQEEGLFSLLYLARGMESQGIKNDMQLTVCLANQFDILGNESFDLAASTIPGVCLVMQQEFSNMECRVLDLGVRTEESRRETVNFILSEMSLRDKEMICALRGERRFIRRYDSYPFIGGKPGEFKLSGGDFCLVYGGAEGIGFLVAKHLLEKKGVRLLLINEPGFPGEEDWEAVILKSGEDHPESQRILNTRALMDGGAIFLGAISRELLQGVAKSYKSGLKGIIHAPGASNAKRIEPLTSVTPDSWKAHFESVAYSLQLLDEFFDCETLDFKMMLNSLGSVLGGVGFVNVATIGNFAKSYNCIRKQEGLSTWSIQCWDSWDIEWKYIKEGFSHKFFKSIEQSILTNDEGIECFEHTYLLKDKKEFVISATDLNNRFHRWVTGSHSGASQIKKHPRPVIETTYRAPEKIMHKKVEKIFSDILGIEAVGIGDDFFDLGGHSLLGVQLAKALEDEFSITLDTQDILLNPSVETLSDLIDSRT